MKFNNKKLKIMKKNLFLYLFMVLSVAVGTGCGNVATSPQEGMITYPRAMVDVVFFAKTPTKEMPTVDVTPDSTIVATMMTTVSIRRIPVAYVLHEDGRVDVLHNQKYLYEKHLPFTKEQARTLMQAKLKGKACNY